VLVLPTGASVSESEVSGVAALLRFLVEHAGEVRARFHSPAATAASASGAGPSSARR
jgi:hypothetical protein